MSAPPPGDGDTGIPGCMVVPHPVHGDARGAFAKPFAASAFRAMGLATDWAECFWSASGRGAVRGFHLQLPPSQHAKLLWAVSGASHSVVLDLRSGSPAYGQVRAVALDASSGRALYVPPGVAHAFQALADDTVVVYLVTSAHDPARDSGVRFDSTPAVWPLPVTEVSVRDRGLPALADFRSPFRFGA